jgi:hypothetical protein
MENTSNALRLPSNFRVSWGDKNARDYGYLESCYMNLRFALSISLLGLISAQAAEITIGRKDTVAVGGTKYIYLGLDISDSCHVMISGGGKIWMYGIPAPDSVPPAPGFTLATHEGKQYHVVRADDSILVLDQLEKTAPPFALPASYIVGDDGFNGELDTTIGGRYYQVWPWSWSVDSSGRKSMGITIERDRGKEQEPFGISVGESVSWHILKITLANVHFGRNTHDWRFILLYEVLKVDPVRPPLVPEATAVRAPPSADALGRMLETPSGSLRFQLPK